MDRCEQNDTTETQEYKDSVQIFRSRNPVCRLSTPPAEFITTLKELSTESGGAQSRTLLGKNPLFYTNGTLKGWSIVGQLKQISKETVPGGMLLVNSKFDITGFDEAMEPFFWEPGCRCKWVKYRMSGHFPMFEETEAFLKVWEISFWQSDGQQAWNSVHSALKQATRVILE